MVMPESIGRLHHVGVVVPDIDRAAELYVHRFGYTPRTEKIHDPVQTAHVQFFRLGNDLVYLELVSPDGPQSKLMGALQRGGGLNHLCFVTTDIDATCRALRARQMLVLHAPVPATAFSGRRIAWLMGEDRIPIELVEAGGPDAL
jgi:methylmalonyl-CoA/ethylmalonyl-CoA epimerase